MPFFLRMIFDATAQAEFLYACVEQTVEVDLPGDVKVLQAFDRFAAFDLYVGCPTPPPQAAGGARPSNGSRLPVLARWRRIASMTLCSVITETIFIADPHAGHRSGSTSKMRRRSRAQLAREGEGSASVYAPPSSGSSTRRNSGPCAVRGRGSGW